ncbi:MAG: restriction modification system DNA specificity domain-containing protein [Bacteroidetes bacterium OLB9]|nr:MAG: restriction modification system DNA specificity domain-containing protein [Bacteroidetes bacterium OLB9]
MGKYKPYEKYKNSGIPWLGEIPEHWEASKIKWLTPVKRGASPRPIDNPIYFSKDGEFSWVRIADVSASRRYLKKTKEKLSDLGASLSVKQYPNDLFLSIAGTVGKPIITKIKCCIHDGFVYFPNLKLNPEYLFYIFTTGIPYQGLGKMGTQLNLNTETVGSITIPLPSNEEIEQIVSFLDYKLAKINRFIRKKKQLIKLLNEQKAAIINQAVTKGLDPNAGMKDSGIEWLGEIPQHWEVRKLKYVAKIFNGSECDKQIEGLYPVYGSGGVFGYHSDYLYDKPSVLLGRKGTLNKPMFVQEPFWSVDTAFYTKINEQVIIPYFFYLVCTTIEFEFYSTKTALPSMTQTSLYEVKLAIPPLSEQQQIVSYIEKETAKLNSTISTIEKEIALVEEYKTALIAEAVTGKIDVRGYQVPEVESEEESDEELEAEMSMAAEDADDYQTEEME